MSSRTGGGEFEKNIAEVPPKQLRDIVGFLARFFERCSQHIPRWQQMVEGEISAITVREQFVIGHAVWLEALAVFGRQPLFHNTDMVPNPDAVIRLSAANWNRMSALSGISLLKNAPMWNGQCVVLGKMQKTAIGVKSTAAQLLKLTEVPLAGGMGEIEQQLLAA